MNSITKKPKTLPATLVMELPDPLFEKVKGKKTNGQQNGQHQKEKILLEELEGSSLDINQLLEVLLNMKNGNFNKKMPVNKVGISGKVCDCFRLHYQIFKNGSIAFDDSDMVL